MRVEYIKPVQLPMHVWMLSHLWLFATPSTVVCQVPLSMELSRQEYRSGLPLLSPGNLLDPGIEPGSPGGWGPGFYVVNMYHVSQGFPGGSDGKESACKARDLGSIPELERPLEKGIATHSSILAWGIPWTEEPGRLQSMVSQRVRHDWATFTHSLTHHVSTGDF